jgi:hypothetical protein
MSTRHAYGCFLDKKNRQGNVEEEKMCEREGDHMSYRLFTKLYGIKMSEYKERAHMYTKGLFNDHAVYE